MKYILAVTLSLVTVMMPFSAHALLLDDVAGATFAFSVSRYLKTAFDGSSVVRLRESATGNELDFKLNGSNVLVSNDANLYTVSQFLALTSATTSYVVSVYDHSGNGRTFTMTETARQPILVEGSDINGLAAIDFSSSSGNKLTSASITINSANGIEVHSLVRPTNISGDDSIIFGDFTSSLGYVGASTTAWLWQADLGAVYTGSQAPTNNTNYQMSHRYVGSNNFIIDSNCTEILNQTDAGRAIDWRTGAHSIGNHAATVNQRVWDGLIAELIFYNGIYSSADVNDIQTSLATQGGVSGCAGSSSSSSLPYRIYNLAQMLLTGGTLIIR